jgi:hypothetical protein
MKLKEILTERISLISHTNEVFLSIKTATNSIITRTYKDYILPEETLEYSSDLEPLFLKELTKVLNQLVLKITHIKVPVKFAKFAKPSTAGAYSYQRHEMLLNYHFIKQLIEQYVNMTNAKIEEEDFSDYLTHIHDLINSCTSIIIHECTHIIQLSKAKSDDLVSSLLEPNTDMVQVAVMVTNNPLFRFEYEKHIGRKLTAVELTHFRDVYLSQPQEITAYAHQTAVQILKGAHQLHSINDKTNFINDQFKKIQHNKVHHKYSHMRHSSDLKLVKVYQKFMTELYMQLQSYKEQL